VYRIAYIELLVCWAVWWYPFLFRAQRVKGRKAAITARVAMWGLALECIAYFVAWFRVPSEMSAARIVIAMVLAAVGPVLGWWAVEHLGRQFRIQAGLWPDHNLVCTGPYAVVRHPIYASMLAMLVATALLNTAWPFVALAVALFVAGTEIRVRTEDNLLAARFGAAFEEYRRRVPAYLPPVR